MQNLEPRMYFSTVQCIVRLKCNRVQKAGAFQCSYIKHIPDVVHVHPVDGLLNWLVPATEMHIVSNDYCSISAQISFTNYVSSLFVITTTAICIQCLTVLLLTWIKGDKYLYV
jgi:hypothetical protein